MKHICEECQSEIKQSPIKIYIGGLIIFFCNWECVYNYSNKMMEIQDD